MSFRPAKGISCALLLLVAQALGGRPAPALQTSSRTDPNPGRPEYAGDEACRACHVEKAARYLHTPHHLTSQVPSKESILGSFADGKNTLKTSNPNLSFRMDSRPDGFYQTTVWASPPGTPSRSEKIGIVIGSGTVGQTYLYWKYNGLFQLPVSYWVDLGTWVNSPGYRDGTANFERIVTPRCLECHLTYAETVSGPALQNTYKPESLVMGISCERCHGPGRAHVEAMARKAAGSIVNPAKLSRDRQIEICAQCHGGRRIPVAPTFSFVPGEPLDKYFRQDQLDPSVTVDVHGNQVGLLQRSRCYQSSADMSCSTCHDVHQTQRDAAEFSNHCLKCHRPEACGEFAQGKEKIVGRCVDCHMPVQPSNLIISSSFGKKTKAMVRSHWIKVYPETATP